MKGSNAFWIAMICVIGGCTQILKLDDDYRPTDGNSGVGAAGGAGGAAGAGGSSPCTVDADCPAAVVATCTEFKCVDLVCVPSNVAQGTPCGNGGSLVCDGNGICGACNQASDCTQVPAEVCYSPACIDHLCGLVFAPNGTKLAEQTVGDCVDAFCDGAGSVVTQPNAADLPEDNNPCTDNLCVDGAPNFPPVAENTQCGAGLKCNASGQCVGCFVAQDCMGTDDFCHTRTCNMGMCGVNYTPAGTIVPNMQTMGDCKTIQCDGQGNMVANNNNMDVPNDGNPCTKDLCTAGTPSNPFEAANTPCGSGKICNSSGSCQKINGTTCSAAAECASGNCVEGYCCDGACNQTCRACNITGSLGKCTNVPAGYSDDSCASPKTCDGNQGAGACTSKLPMGFACTLGTQCGSGFCVDGFCCGNACQGTCQACNVMGSEGSCVNLPSGQTDTNAATMCSGTYSCNGAGSCLLNNGEACAADTECVSNKCLNMVCSP